LNNKLAGPVGILKLSTPIRTSEERGRLLTLLTVACHQSEIGEVTARFFDWNPLFENSNIESTFTITVRNRHHGRA
jgi:hypothetical protein